MVDDDTASKANAAFRAPNNGHEKGSAMSLIAGEAKAIADKTARLRKLREEAEAAIPPEPVKPARKSAKKASAK
jgi:hypothetical protein